MNRWSHAFTAALALAAAVQVAAQTGLPDTPAPAIEPAAPTPPARVAPPRAACPAPRLLAMVTDDPYNTGAEAAERWRALNIPAWHTTARDQARNTGCFTLADPDPLLLALPGAVLPDVILRVRPVKLVLYDKTITDKINEGITGYIESYTTWLGGKKTEGPPLLSNIEMTVAVLCPRARRVQSELSAADNLPPEALIDSNREHTGARQNASRAERAIGKAIDELAGRVARGERLCPPGAEPSGLRSAPSIATPLLSAAPPPAPITSGTEVK